MIKKNRGYIRDYELQVFFPTIGINLEREQVEEVLKRLEEKKIK